MNSPVCSEKPVIMLHGEYCTQSWLYLDIKRRQVKKKTFSKKNHGLVERMYIDKEILSNGSRKGTQLDFMTRMQNCFSTHIPNNLKHKICKNQGKKPHNYLSISMKDMGQNSTLTQYESTEERM